MVKLNALKRIKKIAQKGADMLKKVRNIKDKVQYKGMQFFDKALEKITNFVFRNDTFGIMKTLEEIFPDQKDTLEEIGNVLTQLSDKHLIGRTGDIMEKLCKQEISLKDALIKLKDILNEGKGFILGEEKNDTISFLNDDYDENSNSDNDEFFSNEEIKKKEMKDENNEKEIPDSLRKFEQIFGSQFN